jgi:hypothetical protein
MNAKRSVAFSAVGVTLCAVLLAGNCTGAPGSTERPIVMGDFIVPEMPGWKADIYHGDPISRVDFRKTVDGSNLLLKFCSFNAIKGLPPRSASTLAKDAAFLRKHTAQLAKSTGGAITSKVIASRPARFRGWPAYLLVMNSNDSDEAPATSRVLKFIYGQKEYWISVSYTVQPRSPKAIKAANDGWNQLTARLTRRKQSR